MLKNIKYFSKGYLWGNQDGKDYLPDHNFTARQSLLKIPYKK